MKDEIVYSYIKDIALRLKEPRKYGEVSIMVGAGLSKNACSKGISNVQPPNWSELAEKMYDELYPIAIEWDDKEKEKWNKERIIKTSGKNVTRLAEEYIANFDRNKINNLIEQSIADEMFVPSEVHRQLLKLGWADIFTTNYDTLLERTVDLVYRENNYEIIYSQNDLPGSIRPRIIKLHGSIPQIKPYIICDEDYRTYPNKYSALVNTVQQAMLETRLCLIGFSGDDPNFQSWLGWLRDNMGEECPQIYLIGIYDELSSPEKKLLENKGITIVDISNLVSKNEEQRYYKAISKFLELLEKFQEDENLFEDRPYPQVDIFWKPQDKKEYIKQMQEYARKIETNIRPYILLPENIRMQYEKYFSEHFNVIMRLCLEEITAQVLIYFIKILRKCLVVLDDENAEQLEIIRENYFQKTEKEGVDIEAFCEISLYLLEMYRIDGRRTEYQNCMSNLENYAETTKYHNDIVIEKIKNNIAFFEYESSKKLVYEIEENSFEYKVKKAGFYKQLGCRDIADKILKECSAELAQMKLSEEIYASYLGYLNLCYRIGNIKIMKEYSDLNYYQNAYNTRQIVIEQREKLGQEFFRKDCKEESVLPFNINTNKGVTRIIGESNTIFRKSFSFILALDQLCLPLFSDQIELLPRVVDEIIDSSKSIYWKLSLVIRSDNEKIIDQIITRKTIQKMNEEDVKLLFEAQVRAIQCYEADDAYIYKKYFASPKNILNIMSRLVVFMEDEYIIKYIKIISGFSLKDEAFLPQNIQKILRTISTRFNGGVAKECQDVIFTKFSSKYHLASYFEGMLFGIEEEHIENYYKHAFQLAESLEMTERDNGISQLLLLWLNQPLDKYTDKIKNVIWRNNENVLPESKVYYPFIWEELPFPQSVDFSTLYYNYLMNIMYAESVTETGSVRNDSYGSVNNYLVFLYSTLDISSRKCRKVNFDEPLATTILNKIYNFIVHEKTLLDSKFDFLGEKNDCIQKFLAINETVALVYIESLKIGFVDKVYCLIDKIKHELMDCNIEVIAIDMVEMISKGQYDNCMTTFENIILTKNKNKYSSAFTGIKCLLYYLREINDSKVNVATSFEYFFTAIKYLDIEYAKTIWIHLASLLRCDFFTTNQAQSYISISINKCVEIYEELANAGERNYLDGLYNCISALKQYYTYILERKVEVSRELMECVEIAKSKRNYEISNIWCL